MASTYGELKDRVARDLEPYIARLNGDEIGQAVLDAVEYYADEPLWWLDAVSSGLTTTASQASDTLPTDLLSIDEVTITVNNDAYPLETVPYDYYRWLQTDETDLVGQPFKYSLFNNSIWWYPTPDQAYTYTLYYRKRLTALSADSDTNDWITYGWRLLRWHAEADLAAGPLNLPDPMFARWSALADRELRQLRSKSLGRMMVPRGRPRDF